MTQSEPLLHADPDDRPAPGRRPWRPRLRPRLVVLRRRGAVQLGVDRPDAVVLAPAPPGLADWLRLIDGTRGVADLLRAGARLGLGPEDARRLLDQLRRGGLLTASSVPPSPDVTIRLAGAGRLGRSIARLLARTDVASVELIDDEPVDRLLYPRALGLVHQAAALHAELESDRARSHRARSHLAGGPVPGPSIGLGPTWAVAAAERAWPSRLTILATDRQEADRLHTDALLRVDQPHLLVRASGDGVVVGPLVLPGRTACVRCTDLARSETDRDWPILLSQLCRTVHPVEEPQLSWAAATAVSQALALLSRQPAYGGAAPGEPGTGSWPETVGATLELTRDHRIERRNWPPHPACGCHWTSSGHPEPVASWIEEDLAG